MKLKREDGGGPKLWVQVVEETRSAHVGPAQPKVSVFPQEKCSEKYRSGLVT